MNPHKISRGSSFKGAAAYLLEGHIGEENPDRVAWSATQNVGTDDIELAARLMASTWYDADEVKRANGWNGKGKGTTKEPVLHLSLSWDAEQKPDAAHQEQTARDFLKHIGIENAQAIMVGHNDTDHAHLHIIVNMIDPETGKNIDLGNDTRKMSSFALDYCRKHGIESSPNREKNAALRAEARETGDTSKLEQMEGRKRLSRPEWLAMKAQLLDRQNAEREALKTEQRAAWVETIKETRQRQEIERAALKTEHGADWKAIRQEVAEIHAKHREQTKAQHRADWEAAKATMRAEQAQQRAQWRVESEKQRAMLKAENKPQWAEIYKRQRQEERAVQQAIRFQHEQHRRASTLWGRALGAIGLGPTMEETSQRLAAARVKAFELAEKHHAQIEAKQKAQGESRAKRTAEAMAMWKAGRNFNADALAAQMKANHQAQWQALRTQQTAERAAVGLKVDTAPAQPVVVPAVEAMKAKHQANWQDLSARQKAALPYEGLKAAQGQQWADQRAQHHAEREKAGIKPYTPKGREPDTRAGTPPDLGQARAEADRHDRLQRGITRAEQIDQRQKGRWGGPLSEEARKAGERMQERDREDRTHGKDDYGRER